MNMDYLVDAALMNTLEKRGIFQAIIPALLAGARIIGPALLAGARTIGAGAKAIGPYIGNAVGSAAAMKGVDVAADKAFGSNDTGPNGPGGPKGPSNGDMGAMSGMAGSGLMPGQPALGGPAGPGGTGGPGQGPMGSGGISMMNKLTSGRSPGSTHGMLDFPQMPEPLGSHTTSQNYFSRDRSDPDTGDEGPRSGGTSFKLASAVLVDMGIFKRADRDYDMAMAHMHGTNARQDIRDIRQMNFNGPVGKTLKQLGGSLGSAGRQGGRAALHYGRAGLADAGSYIKNNPGRAGIYGTVGTAGVVAAALLARKLFGGGQPSPDEARLPGFKGAASIMSNNLLDVLAFSMELAEKEAGFRPAPFRKSALLDPSRMTPGSGQSEWDPDPGMTPHWGPGPQGGGSITDIAHRLFGGQQTAGGAPGAAKLGPTPTPGIDAAQGKAVPPPIGQPEVPIASIPELPGAVKPPTTSQIPTGAGAAAGGAAAAVPPPSPDIVKPPPTSAVPPPSPGAVKPPPTSSPGGFKTGMP